jgi:hypothetical protein
MAHLERNSGTGAEVHCFDMPTDQSEVSGVLHDLVRFHGSSRNIWVISGTHGKADGTVDASCAHADFKYEDRETASVTSRLIHSLDYHQLSGRRWSDLQTKGDKNIIVLAWCYSYQWFQKNPF